MARYTCPSCGASYNGKKCRQCYYEHFSEEIAHGSHSHAGEPLVIDSPVRRPIPRKDPFGCEKQTRKSVFPRRQKKQRPFAGLLAIFLMLYSFLPMVRDWGLELEARETAAQMEMALPENLVELYTEGPVTIFAQSDQLTAFADGLRIWVENDSNWEFSVHPYYVTANGFVMKNASLFVKSAPDTYGMGTLYLDKADLTDARITDVQELTFVLEVVDEGSAVLFRTEPITLSTTGQPVPREWKVEGGLTLIDENGLYMESLGYWPDTEDLKYEKGCLLFYVENNTDAFLHMNSLETDIGGKPAALYLWADLPAHSGAVVRMELWDLEDWRITTPSELGNLNMSVEFWDPENYTASVKNYSVTMPMVREEPLVIS